MRFPINKITTLVLVAFVSFAIFGGILLQSNQRGSLDEPGRPQTPLPGAISPLGPAPNRDVKHVTEESVVRFTGDANKQDFLKANNLSSADLKEVAELVGTYIVNRSEDQLKSVGAQVSQQQRYIALLTPNDPIYPQWYTDKISGPAAWDISTGSSSIIVADIDTGFALNHEDLAGRWAPGGKDFVHNDNDPSVGTTNPNGVGVSHGTATAGLLGATSNNSKGVASINWGTKILALQALDDNGEGTTTDVASAVHYAVDQGAKVINMSLGVASPDPILKTELDYARDHDVLVVAAAGNCGSPISFMANGCSFVGEMLYPANYPQVLAVGASDSNDIRASFSSYGPNLDVVAPGSGSIRTTAWLASNQTSLYTTSISGTSFSSPIVAGLAALYRSYKTSSSANETTSTITGSADKLSGMGGQSFVNEYGFGRINAAHTLSGTPPAPATPGLSPSPPETGNTQLPTPSQVVTHPDGTLVRNSGEPEVYLIIDGTRYHIPDIDTFNSYGYSWSDVKIANSLDKQLPISGAKLAYRSGSLVRGDATPNVFGLRCSTTSCSKDHIASIDVFQGLGFSFSEVFVISQTRADAMASDRTITSASLHLQDNLVLDKASGKVYLLDNGAKRWVPSLEIFAANRYSWPKVKSATAGDLQLPDGSNVAFPEGALVRANNDPAVYVIDHTTSSIYQKRHIASAGVFAELGYRLSDVFVVDASYIPTPVGADISY